MTTNSCGEESYIETAAVRFTDRTGQVHTSTITQCDILGSPGDSVTIVYLPSDTTRIERLADLPGLIHGNQLGIEIVSIFALFLIVVLGFIRLVNTEVVKDNPKVLTVLIIVFIIICFLPGLYFGFFFKLK